MNDPRHPRAKMVLVDLSNVCQTCWHPAIAAHEAGEKAWAEHIEGGCQQCLCVSQGTMPTPCPAAPKRYNLQQVYRENLNLKVGTLTEALNVPVEDWLMVKDSRPVDRFARYPEYKAGRKKNEYGDPRPAGEEFFRSRGSKFVIAERFEADDCIAALANVLKTDMDIVIVSSDKDLWALIDEPRVRIYGPVIKEFVSPERIKKSFPDRSKTSPVEGIDDPRHIRLCKALWGDASDNLPNLMPRTQAALTPLIKASDGTLEDFERLFWEQSGLSQKVVDALKANWSAIQTNYYVASLFDQCEVTWLP